MAVDRQRLATDSDRDADLAVSGGLRVDTCRDWFVGIGDLERIGIRGVLLDVADEVYPGAASTSKPSGIVVQVPGAI